MGSLHATTRELPLLSTSRENLQQWRLCAAQQRPSTAKNFFLCKKKKAMVHKTPALRIWQFYFPAAQAQTLSIIPVTSLSLTGHIHGQQRRLAGPSTHAWPQHISFCHCSWPGRTSLVPAKAELIALRLSMQSATALPFWLPWNCLTITTSLAWIMVSRSRKCQQMTC